MKKFLWFCIPFLICSCTPEQDIPVPSSGSADFSKTVVMGGSALAGYRNGALTRESQETGIGVLVARQLAVAGGNVPVVPYLPDGEGIGLNPKPWESLFQTASKMDYKTDCEGETSLSPVKSTFELGQAGDYLNPLSPDDYSLLAVPGVELADWSDTQVGISMLSGGTNPFYNRFATDPGISTLSQDLWTQSPTFLVSWPGLQEIINYATKGAYGLPEPNASDFRTALDNQLSQLSGLGGKGVIATLPDVRDLPFFTTIPSRGLELDSASAADANALFPNEFYQVGENGFLLVDTAVAPGYRQMTADELVCLTLPLDSVKCFLLGVILRPMPDQYSLDIYELARLDQIIDDFNAVILDLAVQYDLAVADMHTYFKSVNDGIVVDGIDLSSEFASGNFFGLDGLYPTAKGAALIGNEFIKAINAKYGAAVPPIRVDNMDQVKFP